MEKYKKPEMKKVVISAERRIADECWKYNHASDPSPIWWYDDNGATHGYVHFQLMGGVQGGCNLSSLAVWWHEGRADTSPEQVHAGDQVYNDKGGGPYTPYDTTKAWLDSLTEHGAASPSFHNSSQILPKDDDNMS